MPAKQKVAKISSRKRTKRILPETGINYRSIFENANEGIFQTTPAGKFLAANPAMARILGFASPEELIRKRTDIARQGYVDPKRREEFKRLIERDGEVSGFECEVYRKDGSTVWVSETARAIRDSNDKTLFFEGFFQDITERKRAEKELQHAVSLLQSTLESTADGILVVDSDGKIVSFNRRFTTLWRIPQKVLEKRDDEAAIKHVLDQLKHPQAFVRRIRELHSTPEVESFDVLEFKDGRVFERYSCPQLFDGKPIGRVWSFRDITERKQTEESLRKSEAHLALAQRIAHFGSWELELENLKDINSNRLFWSDETFRIFGFEPGAVKVTTELFFQSVHPDDRAPVSAASARAIAEKKRYFIEHRIILPSGEIRHVHEEADIVLDEKSGLPLKMAGTVMDITGRKRAEEKMRESQALYHSFVEHLPAGVFRKDYEGRYVFVNSVFCRLKSMKAEEILGKTPRELAAYEKKLKNARFKRTARQNTLIEGANHHELILQNGKPIEIEEAYPQPDGRIEHFHVVKSPVFGPDGHVIGSQGFQFDITARKRAEEELFSSQHMLRTILDTIPQRVFWKDKNSVYVGCNKPLANDCGFEDPGELIGKDDYETKSAATADMYRADDRDVMETRRAKLNYEEPQVKADGATGWLRTSKVPLFDKDGNVTGVLGTYEDITEIKRLEEQLRQAQKMDAFGQLAAGVAHDFNNILTVIQGNLSLLRMGLNSKADEASAIEQALAASERAANLTRQLLTFGRRQPIQPKPLDLNNVIANMTKMLQRLIGEHIALEAHHAPGGAPVLADVNMMEQILINLAVNSRDAMPKGGKLVVEITSVPIDEPTATAMNRRAGEFIRFSITDDGTGIAPEHLPHIFEPFFTTKDVGKGTGLGLATVFGIIQQHDGWIKVESKVGQGTTFHVFLPRFSKNLPPAIESPSAPRARGGNEIILLVEDEVPVRELMRMLLARAGYKIHEAASGNEALKLWSALRDKIDLLITDMVMPDGITGQELAEKLRAEKSSLKVIYCSGYNDDMLGENSPLRNNPNFLEKPFEPQKLLQRVRDCLDGY